MYTMNRTPRSSFMSMGDTITPTVAVSPSLAPTYQPVVVMTPPTQSPPFVAPTASAVPATATTDSSPNYGMYVLAGGAALVAYWLLFGKEG